MEKGRGILLYYYTGNPMTAARSQKIGRKGDGTAYERMEYILPKRIAQGRLTPQQKTPLPFGNEALRWWR